MDKINIEEFDEYIDVNTVKLADPHSKLIAEKVNEIIDWITSKK